MTSRDSNIAFRKTISNRKITFEINLILIFSGKVRKNIDLDDLVVVFRARIVALTLMTNNKH